MNQSKKELFAERKIVIFGGTGSLGKHLIKRILTGECGEPKLITVASRDEAKQYEMRLQFEQLNEATEELIYKDWKRVLQFQIADVRDPRAVRQAVADADFVFNTAALKQVPSCEYFPYEAVLTNICGTENIINAILESKHEVKAFCSISTDKACKPVNAMGMTKALQEKLVARANIYSDHTSFFCVRYGNVLASRGSVVPLFLEQISRGEALTITTRSMTRFLLSLDQAVDTIFEGVSLAGRGHTYVPVIPSAKIDDLADVMIGRRAIEKQYIGIRPGEKEHEILISEEESRRTVKFGDYYAVLPLLPELQASECISAFPDGGEYSSCQNLLAKEEIYQLLQANDLLPPPSFVEKRRKRVPLI